MDTFRRISLLCLVSCISLPICAGNRPQSLSLSAGIGNIYFPTKQHVQNSGLGFIGGGYNFTYHWGIDAILGFFTSTSRLASENGKDVNGTLFAFDALYRFNPYHHFEAYLLAGPGIIGLNPTSTDPNNEGNINAGLGAQYFIDKSLAFRAEARDFYTITGGKNAVMIDAGMTYLIDV